jgi:hypothetical protein
MTLRIWTPRSSSPIRVRLMQNGTPYLVVGLNPCQTLGQPQCQIHTLPETASQEANLSLCPSQKKLNLVVFWTLGLAPILSRRNGWNNKLYRYHPSIKIAAYPSSREFFEFWKKLVWGNEYEAIIFPNLYRDSNSLRLACCTLLLQRLKLVRTNTK